MTWLLLALVILCVPRPPLPRLRLGCVGPSPPAGSGHRLTLNQVGAAAAAVAALVVLPLPWSVPAAALAAAAAHRFLPVSFSREGDRQALAVAKALPDAIDLLAAVLRAGLPDTDALALVAGATPAPLGGQLAVVAQHRRWGATPAQAWRSIADLPQVSDLATAMARHADTGSPIAAVLDRVAADARRDFHSHAQAAARAAAVRAVIPLAACFLPSFVLLGVVPIVASLLSDLSF